MLVKNLVNTKGNTVANQFVITEEKNGIIESVIFQSYESVIAIIKPIEKKLIIGSDFDYSITTMKHLKKFFSDYPMTTAIDSVKTLRKFINAGGYIINNGVKIVVEYNETLK